MFINGRPLTSFFHKYIFWNQPVSSASVLVVLNEKKSPSLLTANAISYQLPLIAICFSDIFKILMA